MAGEKQTVVVAVDGSKHSEHALRWYLKKLRKPGDKVLLTHCVEHVGHYPPLTSLDTDFADLAKEKKQQMEHTIQKINELAKANNLDGSVTQVSGHPGQALVKTALDNKADLIVCGSRGAGATRRTLLGSVSDYVMHHSIVPVVVCKHEDEHHKLQPTPEPDESASCFT